MPTPFPLPLSWSRTLRVAALALCSLLASEAAAQPVVASDFDVDGESWTLLGGATAASPVYLPSGGNPAGAIEAIDLCVGGCDIFFWVAPEKFRGDLSAYYGGMLSWDIFSGPSGSPFVTSDDVRLRGAGLVLEIDAGAEPPLSVWTPYEVALNAAAGWVVQAGGSGPASEAQLQSVLANLESLEIRGEFRNGFDSGRLDNVVLAPPPQPVPASSDAALAIVATLLGALGASRLRNRCPQSALVRIH